MANEVLVGLKIGAAVSSTLSAAFGSARSTVQQLGRATDSLTARQRQLGTELSAALARGGTGIERMRRQYDQVGRTIDQLRLKQERLTASIARGETLKAQRADLRGEFMETAGTAVALGAPIVQSVRVAMDFKDQARDIAITGGFDEREEKRLSDVMRGSALKWNQTQTEVARGTAVLIAGGIADAKELAAYAPVLAKTATATRASMDDLGAVAIALNDSLGISAAGLERSMNMLAYAGKRGQFELADMAKWLPQLAPQFAALGITGERAVAEIGASLQIARRGAGSNDEAANNFRNFLAKITAPDTLRSFQEAGIDLQGSMHNLVSAGMTPMQAMLEIITKYMGSKGPAAAGELQKALALKDGKEREAALQRLSEAYALGELFRDMQVMSFLRPALANRADQTDIQKGSMEAADQGVNDQDWRKRMGSPKEELKSLMISLTEIGIAVGGALLPAIVDVTRAIVPMAQAFGAWAEENPTIVRGIVGLVGGLLAGKLALVGLKYGVNLVLSPFNAMTTTVTSLSARWTRLRAMWQAGRFVPLVTGLSRVGAGMLSVLRFSGLFLRGVGMAFGAPVMLAGRGLLTLAGILGGSLVTGLRLAGHAVLWLGRALMLNPIGLAITAIAGAAYLIYRYWEPIKGFFSGLWNELKSDAGNGITGILSIVANFSPLGLFYRGFAGVMNYFGVEMPARFSEFGGMLIQGLVSGIRRAAGAVKDVILSIGGSIKEWFAGTLGIHSPSRVFIGYGQNIGEGAALGIAGSRGLVRDAAMGLAGASDVRLSAPSLAPVAGSGRGMAPPNMAAVSAASAMGGTAVGDVTFNYNPVIHLPGGGPEAGAQLQAGLRMSFAEFERHMREFMRQEQRLSFSGGRS
ncbi:TPA: phage tail tape measure protein [Pseudomonas aeruginosa]|uniref:phage tail tape measure protein n=1 Tax=Pseudomonas aeruginosa TaxID=287 RepID=UPI0009371768|nr:phage tail tape measure protein [Pseudomonas aeruginosa]RCM51504.1 phage tail tape measure protein, TP901 family, core region [Pseudomonas aeruginosa]HBP5712261.1 phage tail tape measure protein [Pseudomonas aeruginosa]HCT4763223.1 phage tail tape measure protein [Pseudomonas aeruginosa]HDZ6692591.1 phage tail tape measure protein [Pseudomonas aeruginosa]